MTELRREQMHAGDGIVEASLELHKQVHARAQEIVNLLVKMSGRERRQAAIQALAEVSRVGGVVQNGTLIGRKDTAEDNEGSLHDDERKQLPRSSKESQIRV